MANVINYIQITDRDKSISGGDNLRNGGNPYFPYYDGVANAIDNLPMNTNILNDYDNVTYHCDLFAYGKNTQKEIDEKLSKDGYYEPNKEKRCYICKDGVTTKFYIDSFIMKSKYGNHQNVVNVATYSIELTIKETFSCILSHELDVLGILSGYNSYLQRPYWIEIWFSGYDKLTGLPVERIPLPNGEKSIIYEGYFSKMISHMDSSGTTWKATFFPIYTALTQKNTNILNVSTIIKNSGKMNLKDFLQKCTDDMFERFLKQVTKDDDEAGRAKIRAFYNNSSNNVQDKTTPSGENPNNQEQKTNKEKAQEKFDRNQTNGFITFKLKRENGEDFTEANNITSNLDSSTKDSEKNSEKQNVDKTILFTTICQEFLLNSEKYDSYIAKYDIKSSVKGYYNNNPLYHHDVDIYLVEDPYITAKLKAYDKNKENYIFTENEAVNYVNKFIAEGVLIKKYQYGFSGEDTSVIEIDNKYDKLYYMNALPQAGDEWVNSNILFQNKNNDKDKNKNNIVVKSGDTDNTAGIEFNGENLEDIYLTMNKKNVAEGVIKYNKIPELNNDLSNDNRRTSTTTNDKKSKRTIAATMLWKNLYKSDQMVTTSFTILGDPYWLATNSFRTNQYNKNIDLLDKLPDVAPNIPDYRCVFIIKSSPEQNQFYDLNNPTDYTFENSLYASGIYIVTDVESIFEGGKFTQKIKGHIDIRFIKE